MWENKLNFLTKFSFFSGDFIIYFLYFVSDKVATFVIKQMENCWRKMWILNFREILWEFGMLSSSDGGSGKKIFDGFYRDF
jgi:hypothetical protein